LADNKTMSKPKMWAGLLGVILLVFFQNCGGHIGFSSSDPGNLISTHSNPGHGDGYLGKQGNYARTNFDYICPVPLAIDSLFQGIANAIDDQLTVLRDNCRDLTYQIPFSDPQIDYAGYNPDFIGLNSAIFEKIPEGGTISHVTEVFCRWGDGELGLDPVIRISQDKSTLTGQMYLGSSLSSATPSSQVVAPFAITRLEDATRTIYDGTAFHLEVQKANNANGIHAGSLQTTVDNKPFNLTLNCRVAKPEPALTPNDSGLIGLWQFNGAPGTAANLSPVLDLSGNGHHGTVVDPDNTLFYSASPFQTGITLNGKVDYVDIAPTAKLNNLGALTVSAWVRTTPQWGGGLIGKFDQNYVALNSGWVFHIPGQTTRLSFSAGFTDGTIAATTTAGCINSSSAWTNVAMTWDGSGNAATGVKFYADGVACPLSWPWQDRTGFRTPDDAAPVRLFPEVETVGFNYTGDVDQMMLWNRALSPTEIQQLFVNGAL
jgi:hypothetical protein